MLCLSFQERLFSCHKGECHWSGECCSVAWLTAPEDQPSLAIRSCLGRLLSLCECPALPVVASPPELESSGVDPEVLPLWLAKAGRAQRIDGLDRVTESGRPLAGAALLALCGWSYSAQHRSVGCETCGARAPSQGSVSAVPSVGVDVGEMAVAECLDPVEGHRVFCPWARRHTIHLKTPAHPNPAPASASAATRSSGSGEPSAVPPVAGEAGVLVHSKTSRAPTAATAEEPTLDPPSAPTGPVPSANPRGNSRHPPRLIAVEPAPGPAGWEVMLQVITGRQTKTGSDKIVSPEEALRIVRETLNSATSRKRRIQL